MLRYRSNPTNFTVTLHLLPAIQRASHAISAFVDIHTRLRVTQSEAHILAQLAEREVLTVGQIHAAFGHKRSTLTSILNRLEDRGLVTCQVNAADKRSFLIGLTPPGETLARELHEKLENLEKEILDAFSARDQKSALWILAAATTVADRVESAT